MNDEQRAIVQAFIVPRSSFGFSLLRIAGLIDRIEVWEPPRLRRKRKT